MIDSPGLNPGPVGRWGPLLWAVLALVALFLTGLGAPGLFDPDEGRYAAIPAAMLRSGDFLIPRLGGFPYLEKPPLLYWLTAGALAIFGENEFAARLPVALAGLLGLGAAVGLAWRALGPRPAALTAGILASSALWLLHGRYLSTDMLLAALLALALGLFWLAWTERRPRLLIPAYLALALGVLTKGIIALVLPALIFGLFALWTGRWRLVLVETGWWWGAALVGLVAGPWFFLVQARFPQFFHFFIIEQHFSRFAANVAEHSQPAAYFIPVLLVGLFPWSIHLLCGPRAGGGAGGRRWFGWRGPEEPLTGDLPVFLLCWFLAVFLFFSASKGKLVSYILPAVPALAVLLARGLDRLWEKEPAPEIRRAARRASLIAGGIWLVLGPAALAILPWLIVRDERLKLEDVARFPYIFGAVWGLGGLVVVLLSLRRSPRAALLAQGLVALAFLGATYGVSRAIEPLLWPTPLVQTLAHQAKPEDTVVVFRCPQQSLEFYLGRPPLLIDYVNEYRFGRELETHPELYQPDPTALRRLIDSGQTVFFLAEKNDKKLAALGPLPVEKIAENSRRAVWRTKKGIRK